MADKLDSYEPKRNGGGKAPGPARKSGKGSGSQKTRTGSKAASGKGCKHPAAKKAAKKKTGSKSTRKKKAASRSQAEPGPSPRKKTGRPATMSKAEAGKARLSAAARYQREADRAARDIRDEHWLDLIQRINWERRLASKLDLKFFLESYLNNVFSKSWSSDQLRCVKKAEDVFLRGGMFALAMPRGGGKTAICRGALVWGTAHAHRRFPYFIGSTQPAAIQSLDAVKMLWYRSADLRQDFPEVGWAIYKLENRFHLARAQSFDGLPTFAEWGSENLTFPSCLLPQEDADHFLAQDPDCLEFIPEFQKWLPLQAGVMVTTSGIDGSIRGEAEVHPIRLSQPRPDLVLMDDIQKDQKAESPAACEKMIRLVDGAISGLTEPGEHIAALMPCTVIREGDVADHYLDPMGQPEWQGERCRMVDSWPPGITDREITLETEAGKLWTRYDELRRNSLRAHGDIREATAFYKRNRKVMDEDFRVSWKERFTTKGKNPELSAQQHAMNLRFRNPETFASEFQNIGKNLQGEGDVMITSEALAKKTVHLDRGQLPVGTKHLAAFMDIQNEVLFYTVLAVDQDFTGVIVDYGTFPQRRTRYFTKNQTEGWGQLTSLFFQTYPEQKRDAVRSASGKYMAPLEAKIYHALSVFVPQLLTKTYVMGDEHQTTRQIDRLAIDTRWGQVSDVIKRWIRESGLRNVIPYYGQSFPPAHKQLEEYQRTGQYRTWLFEDQQHPHVKEPKWVIRPNPDGMFYLQADVDRGKDFLMNRLASPPGSPGSISLFQDTPEGHELFADHVTRSEYPEPNTMRGRTKNKWLEREGAWDNDWLDCSVGCCILASWLGASVKTAGDRPVKKLSRKLSDLARQKKKKGA